MLLILQSQLPPVPACSFYSQVQPHVALGSVQCPPPPGLMNFYQSHLSSVRCHAFGYPLNPRIGIPLSAMG